MSPISQMASTVAVPLACVLCCLAPGQSRPGDGNDNRSAAELIAFLTYQAGRPDRALAQGGVLGCGPGWADRRAAEGLARLGASAMPQLEAALDSIEQRGKESEFAFNADWLLYAYAGIKGRQACPRLLRMAAKPDLGLRETALDAAVAVSLGLTSYVSPSRPLGNLILCRVQEPRDALDKLIVSWERNNPVQLRAILGPSARASLKSLQRGRTWNALRSELWPGRIGRGRAIGYRFETACRWADPEYKLPQPDRPDPPLSATVDLSTAFKDATGSDCARQTIRFIDTTGGTLAPEFRVDSADIESLLRAITACAVRTHE